jgi:phytanoyl-CoA hydroxylase
MVLARATEFSATGGGYIYGRYKRVGETAMDESFFPVLWSTDGTRSTWLSAYCQDALTPP